MLILCFDGRQYYNGFRLHTCVCSQDGKEVSLLSIGGCENTDAREFFTGALFAGMHEIFVVKQRTQRLSKMPRRLRQSARV